MLNIVIVFLLPSSSGMQMNECARAHTHMQMSRAANERDAFDQDLIVQDANTLVLFFQHTDTAIISKWKDCI